MKSDYEKVMQEVWDMKDQVYKDYQKSGDKSYIDFVKTEVKKIKKERKIISRTKIPM